MAFAAQNTVSRDIGLSSAASVSMFTKWACRPWGGRIGSLPNLPFQAPEIPLPPHPQVPTKPPPAPDSLLPQGDWSAVSTQPGPKPTGRAEATVPWHACVPAACRAGLGSQYFLKCKYQDHTGLSVNSLSHYTGLNYSALLRPPQERAGAQSMRALVGWMESGPGHGWCQDDGSGPREAARSARHKGNLASRAWAQGIPRGGDGVI